jgi:hypothetical protein
LATNPVCSCPAGLFDVLPAGCLDGLTAEDFRLLLNGVGDINVATLISYTSFNDESGEPGDRWNNTHFPPCLSFSLLLFFSGNFSNLSSRHT